MCGMRDARWPDLGSLRDQRWAAMLEDIGNFEIELMRHKGVLMLQAPYSVRSHGQTK